MKFRKKPVVVEAMRWNGGNIREMVTFMDTGKNNYSIGAGRPIVISTLEGDMECPVGDYVIKGVRGELYPCKSDIFLETYEEAE